MPAPTEAQVREYLKTLSNWGRWGSEDELGTINLITPAKRVGRGAARHRRRERDLRAAHRHRHHADTTFQPMRFMVDSGEGRDTVSPERALQRRGRRRVHRHGLPRLHHHPRGRAVPLLLGRPLYNGRSCNLVTSREGATVNSVEVLRDGVVSRGVLLDVARTQGVHWLEAGEGVMPEDLEAAEKAAGRARRVRAISCWCAPATTAGGSREGPVQPAARPATPALHAACCPWLRERGVAMIGTDTHNDVAPPPYPSMGNSFHVVCLVAMGLWLIDNANLEDLARTAARRNRWEFLLTIAPLRLKNVTGSPVNPIAVF